MLLTKLCLFYTLIIGQTYCSIVNIITSQKELHNFKTKLLRPKGKNAKQLSKINYKHPG